MNTSTTRLKSAKEERDHMTYMYQLHRSMSNHPESTNYVAGDLQLEKLVEQKAERLAREAETRRIKSGKKEPVDPRNYS